MARLRAKERACSRQSGRLTPLTKTSLLSVRNRRRAIVTFVSNSRVECCSAFCDTLCLTAPLLLDSTNGPIARQTLTLRLSRGDDVDTTNDRRYANRIQQNRPRRSAVSRGGR